jgi:hypothetical protein
MVAAFSKQCHQILPVASQRQVLNGEAIGNSDSRRTVDCSSANPHVATIKTVSQNTPPPESPVFWKFLPACVQ